MIKAIVGIGISIGMVVGSIYVANLLSTRVFNAGPVGNWGAKAPA